MCLSSSGTNETNTVSKFEPPSYTQSDANPLWGNYVNQAVAAGTDWQNNAASKVYPMYDANNNPLQVAPLSQQQIAGVQGIDYLAGGDQMFRNASNSVTGTLAGDYAQHAEYNPFGGMSNPYIDQMVQQSNQDITDQYGRSVAPQTDAAAAMGGAFGGSQYQKQVGTNQRNLADSLARNTTGIMQTQYTNAANLEQQRINQEAQNYENERQRQIQTLGLIPGLQGGQLNVLQGQMGTGATMQGQYQQILDALKNQWNAQLQAPLIGLDITGNALTRGSGGAGTTSVQTMGPGYSPLQTGIAGLLGASGLYSLFGGGK